MRNVIWFFLFPFYLLAYKGALHDTLKLMFVALVAGVFIGMKL